MPTATHTASAKVRFHPCKGCCLKMHCGYNDDGTAKWPPRLGFIASIAGSCPEASASVVSGQVSAEGDAGGGVPHFPTCDDLATLHCESGWPYLCTCEYYWENPSPPTCGPYVHNITLQCLPRGRWNLPTDCAHMKKVKRLWYVTMDVYRATIITAPPHGCIADLGTGITTCPKQDCETCTWSLQPTPIADATHDALGCCTSGCPPCYNCPAHRALRCAANAECCGTDGCGACECDVGIPCTGDCEQCSQCIQLPPGTGEDADPSCDVVCGFYRAVRYHFWAHDCDEETDVKGCNPTSCPPDPDNTGGFYLRVGCSEADYVEFSCP
jgi:hypothetical protein